MLIFGLSCGFKYLSCEGDAWRRREKIKEDGEEKERGADRLKRKTLSDRASMRYIEAGR